jgi:1-acyl-sn-glycerol-3-phosphate acyltransferase
VRFPRLFFYQTAGALMGWFLRVLTILFTGVLTRGYLPARPDKARIFYGNHTSHLDFMVIWTALGGPSRRRTRPVAGADYWQKGPMRRFIARFAIHALLVDRTDPEKRKLAVPRMVAALDVGDSLILFPEGTRGDGAAIGEFKGGLYAVAKERPNVELVPVYMTSLSRSLPKGVIVPVPVAGKAYFAPPIFLKPDESREEFLARAREALIEASKAV